MSDPLVEFARDRIAKGSRSFATAAKLFDPETRASAYLLYAWCRHCDDEIDDQRLGSAAREVSEQPPAERLERLTLQTRQAIRGEADEPVFQALAQVVARHAIPEQLPLDHIAGFAMDATGRHYRSLDDTLSYCYHVAGVVGVMMAMVMGVRDQATLERACDLGIAFQLTNICRDVVDDAKNGRIYLPENWLRAEGVDPEYITADVNREALHRVAVRILNVADGYYQSAAYGLAHLPLRSAAAIGAARAIYRGIGVVVRTRGAAAWDQRAVASTSQRVVAFVSGAGLSLWMRAHAGFADPQQRQGLWTKPNLAGPGRITPT